MILLGLVAAALGADVYEGELIDLDVGGDVKAFTIATFPYASVLMPDSPTGQGIADLRGMLDLRVSSWLRFTAHHAITSFIPAPEAGAGLGGFASAGAGLTAPEAVDLTWTYPGEDDPRDSLYVQGRTDRMMLSLRLPHVDLTLGRQPVTFGKAMFFTPLDVINPFSPAVIDSSYKPGVDAARADVYIGMTTQITAVAAYADGWSPDGMIYGLYGQGTLGVWDLGGFAGYVREDVVLGLATAGSAGPVGLRGEASFTRPAEDLDEDPFVRAVVGADWLPRPKLSLSSEVYFQSNGASDPSEYLTFYQSERALRGELLYPGMVYVALATGVEITPLVRGSVAVIYNVLDTSALLAPSVGWSISEDSELAIGLYHGAGSRPDALTLEELVLGGEDALGDAINTEYGLVPTTGFLQVKAYF